MSRVVWTDTARADLRAIHSYISKDSKQYADGVISRIKSATLRLRRFPLAGWMVSEWQDPDLREILSGNYRIIYRPDAGRVHILTVIHGAMQLPSSPGL